MRRPLHNVSFTFACVAALAASPACAPNTSGPGREKLGTYGFQATPVARECALADGPGDAFSFDATLTRDPDTNDAYMTLGQFSRDAGWDGQTMESTIAAPRAFGGECASCPMALEETIRVGLLSESQNTAAQNRCPDGPLPAVDEDAGIRAPASDKFGFDAVRACGVLIDSTRVTGLLPGGGACPGSCSQCSVQYRLIGVRK